LENGQILSATSNGSFELDGMPTSGFLQGSIYLFGAIGGTESAMSGSNASFNGDGFVRACVEGSCVEANYNGTRWIVDVSLPDLTDSFFTDDLNHYFLFTIPVTLPRTIDINATSRTLANSFARADFESGATATAQGMANLSASAWAVFTPTDEPLPEGDFDGDGDVDGADRSSEVLAKVWVQLFLKATLTKTAMLTQQTLHYGKVILGPQIFRPMPPLRPCLNQPFLQLL